MERNIPLQGSDAKPVEAGDSSTSPREGERGGARRGGSYLCAKAVCGCVRECVCVKAAEFNSYSFDRQTLFSISIFIYKEYYAIVHSVRYKSRCIGRSNFNQFRFGPLHQTIINHVQSFFPLT